MNRFTTLVFSSMLAVFAFLLLHVHAASADLSLTYCSSQNTGSDNGANFWQWQSNGWCFDTCKGDYALGVVQGNDCWCSNYIPEDQADTSDCNQSCPGFPREKCGSSDGKLFGYIALEKKPSGTQGASQPTSANSKDPSSAAPTTLETSASSAEHTDAPTQGPSNIQIITLSGTPVTKTIVTAPTGATQPVAGNRQKGTNVGAIVGGVLGGIALIGAIVGAIFFLWRRRQQNEDGDQSGIQRNTSTMSKAGLLRTEKVAVYPPKIATNFSRNSRIMHDGDSISPVSGSDRRSSRPYIFDQRLNPSAIMNLDNTSRGSFVSMDDSRDYGRTLNVRNPDPDPDK